MEVHAAAALYVFGFIFVSWRRWVFEKFDTFKQISSGIHGFWPQKFWRNDDF